MSDTSPPHPARGAAPGGSPPARRASAPTWRDPRLVLGTLIVAACVVAGTALFSAADDTVPVWAVRADLATGSAIGPEDLLRREVRFASAEDADRYLLADGTAPTGATLERAVGAGELLPRAALGGSADAALVEVPLSVEADAVPDTVRTGSLIDVWVTPDAAADPDPVAAVRVFAGVRVVAAPVPGSALAPAGTRQVIVGIEETQQPRLADALARLAAGATVVTRRG